MLLDEKAKKTTLRMIPYGLYVLGTSAEGRRNAATVNWVSQASFEPPLVMVGVKADSDSYALLRGSGVFSLSFLQSGQKDIAFAFFKSVDADGKHVGDTGTSLAPPAPPSSVQRLPG